MKRLAVTLISSLAVGCSPFATVQRRDSQTIAEESQRRAETLRNASTQAQSACAHLKDAPVSFVEEHLLGGKLTTSFIMKNGGATADEVTKYLAVVGRNLASYSSRPDLPWTFAAIESDSAATFSAPGGYVLVTTGLLKKLTNEAQLAGLLSHEIANVTHKNGLAAYVRARHEQCVTANTAAHITEVGLPNGPGMEAAKYARRFAQLDLEAAEDDFANFLMNSTVTMLMFGNEKDAEFENDRAALQLVAFAGYDALEYERVLTALGTERALLANHPPVEDRVAKLKALREGDFATFATGTAKPPLGVTLP